MCGRYLLKQPLKALDFFGVPFDEFSEKAITPRFNIAPTQVIPVVSAPKTLKEMRWSIIPPWGGIVLNARRETVREKATFKRSFAVRRCLVPADGFYEWVKGITPKRPFMFTVNQGEPFAIGAFYNDVVPEIYKGENVPNPLPRVCLVTTQPNDVLLPVHDRMPVIVRKEDWEQWLEPAELDEQSFTRLTAPYSAAEMSAVEVSPIVNKAKTDCPDCCSPVNSA